MVYKTLLKINLILLYNLYYIMEDIDYVKYILNKYIKFDNNEKKNNFIRRLKDNKKDNNNCYTYQLTNALVIASKSSKIDNERETNLLDENQKLKDELHEWKQRAENNKKSCRKVMDKAKQDRQQKDLEIKNLQYDLDILTKKYNNIKNGEDIRKGISLLEMDSDGDIDSSSDEDIEDPASELYEGLH